MAKNQALVLTLNAGSSSLKFAVFKAGLSTAPPQEILRGQISGIGGICAFESPPGKKISIPDNNITSHKQALGRILAWLDEQQFPVSAFTAAGHRIVHGGDIFTSPVHIDENILAALKKLEPLAPHHMPHNLHAITALDEIAPGLPQIGCFDTAFHASQPLIETRLPLPQSWHDKGIRRYGFHGLNYQHVVSALPQDTNAPLPRRLIIVHLGNGASACALRDGSCASTTMGFSTLDGLIMATRSGSIDPGVLLHLLKEENIGINELEDMLYNRSGLLGLSGISGDMRVLLADKTPAAQFAIDKYCLAAASHIGSLIPAIGGIDALVFTGGIGENSPRIRAGIMNLLSCFGLAYDPSANNKNRHALAAAGSPVDIRLIRANEESTIARQCCRLVRF